MTHLARGDEDLHEDNGEHRTTASTANGSDVARHEGRIMRHLDDHRRAEAKSGPVSRR